MIWKMVTEQCLFDKSYQISNVYYTLKQNMPMVHDKNGI